MRAIWKFPLAVADDVVIYMPLGAEVLHVAAASPDTLVVWAVVDPDAPRERRTFHVRGTGHQLGVVGPHIGTVQIGPFVWHVFEGVSTDE